MPRDNTIKEIYVVEFYVYYRGWQTWKGFWFETQEAAEAAAKNQGAENKYRVVKFIPAPVTPVESP